MKIGPRPSICISRKFEYVGDLTQMRRGPTGTDRRTFSVATGDYVANRPAGYENQAFQWSPVGPQLEILLVDRFMLQEPR